MAQNFTASSDGLTPLVSVIVNCRNGAAYLDKALDSIMGQTMTDYEAILVDNCSTDNSIQMAEAHALDIRVVQCPHPMDLGAARNIGIDDARGKYICFHDVDDTWHANKLQRQIEFMAENNLQFSYAGVAEVTEAGFHLRDTVPDLATGELLGQLLRNFDINMVTPMFQRSSVTPTETFGFDPAYQASEEYDLFMRLAVHERFGALNEVLGTYTVREGSLTNDKLHRWYKERAGTLRKLRKMKPEIEHSDDFKEARYRGFYYLACYLMANGRSRRARSVLAHLLDGDRRYRILYGLAHIPPLWTIVHRRKTKAMITRLVNSILKR